MTLGAAGDARHSETCEYRFKPLPEGARFCPGCGTPVVDLAPRDDWVLEKRQATVLLCDLVNSVRIRETLGPEGFTALAIQDNVACPGLAPEIVDHERGLFA